MSQKIHRLSNGFRIVTEHMPSFESASIGVWVNVGGRHETKAENGIAHFLEHMAFKGTKTRSAVQIAEEIEGVGGHINAYTSREATAYYARVLGGDVPLALEVLGDILRNSVLDLREIEVERNVILQEIGRSLDTPDDVIFDWVQEAAYPDQPMGRPILGPVSLVKSFQQSDLAAFIAHHYAPDRMILSAAGAVDHEQIVLQAEKLFGDMPAANGSKRPEAAAFRSGERREVKELEQAHFALAFEAPGYDTDEIFTAQLFSNAFGGCSASRLFQEAREKRGLCYSIGSFNEACSDAGLMLVYSGTSAEKVDDLAELTIEELKRSAEDMTETELKRARAQMKASLLMGLESSFSRAERSARMLGIWDRVIPVSETVSKIDAVTVQDTRKFAEDLVSASKVALALYGQIEGARNLSEIQAHMAA